MNPSERKKPSDWILIFVAASILGLVGCRFQNLENNKLSSEETPLCNVIIEESSAAETATDWLEITQIINDYSGQRGSAECLLRAMDTVLMKLKSVNIAREEMRSVPLVVNALEEFIFEARDTAKEEESRTVEAKIKKREKLSYKDYLNNIFDSNIRKQASGYLSIDPEPSQTFQEHMLEALSKIDSEAIRSLGQQNEELATDLIRAHLELSYYFSSLGARDLIIQMEEHGPPEDEAKNSKSFKNRLSKMKNEKHSILWLRNTLESYIVSNWNIISAVAFSRIWEEVSQSRINGVYYSHMLLKEGDIWLQTSSDASGPGDLLSQITNFPGFTNHAGLVGMEVESGVPIYYMLEMSLRLNKKPLQFPHHVIVRRKGEVQAEITSRALANLERFPKLVFDGLFNWGIEPINGVSYIYCTEFIHFFYATEFAPRHDDWSKSPYAGAEILARWSTPQLEKNAISLGYSNEVPILFSAPLFFSAATELVGGSFEKSRPARTEAELFNLEAKKLFQDAVVAKLETRSLKSSSALKDSAANMVLSFAGMLYSNAMLRNAIPRAVAQPLALVETFDFGSRRTFQVLSFFAGIQSSIMYIKKQSEGLDFETFDRQKFLTQHLEPRINSLFEE